MSECLKCSALGRGISHGIGLEEYYERHDNKWDCHVKKGHTVKSQGIWYIFGKLKYLGSVVKEVEFEINPQMG